MVHRAAPQIPVILVSGRRPEELAQALAADYPVCATLSKDQLWDLPALIFHLLHDRRSPERALL
jgi:hypothetical protein